MENTWAFRAHILIIHRANSSTEKVDSVRFNRLMAENKTIKIAHTISEIKPRLTEGKLY